MTGGNLSTAVRNQRAPRLVEADDATRALWRKLDWFATPPWATRAGAEIVRSLDPEALDVWEPACGDGIMSRVLAEFAFDVVYASDIHPEPPMHTGEAFVVDFLEEGAAAAACGADNVDWIITNPPFALAADFTRRAQSIAMRGVAMLCRLNWLESVQRYPLFGSLHAVYVFSERVPMQLGPWDPDCSSATAYAWFVWLRKDDTPSPALRFIPPGTRERLTRPDDIRRFCKPSAAPLLD